MHIVLGGTGKVGSAAARALLRSGESVTVVTRDAGHAAELNAEGAAVAVANLRDVAALRGIFQIGTRAFLLSPAADPAGDIDTEERANVAAIIGALEGSGLEKLVAVSTYGARAGGRCGDLTVLHGFEEKLRAQPIPAAIHRGAYFMSNWAGYLDPARVGGKLPSFFPADLRLPMVAPEDLGEAAAERLLTSVEDTGLRHVEGPERYTPRDVAGAFSGVLGRPVDVETIPRAAWVETFRTVGFSDEAAASYACMTAAVVDGRFEIPDDPIRGTTTLRDYVESLKG